MRTRLSILVDRLRQPEYTGENRCLPCTAVNVAIAVFLTATAAGLTLYVAGPTPAALAGIVVFGFALAMIALRGYLVPGTPTLTRRYLPRRLRDRFHDRPSGIDDGADLDLAMKGVGANRSSVQSPSEPTQDSDDGDDNEDGSR